MFFIFLGLLVIALGITYRVYQIFFKIKNNQAKLIFEEIKKRVEEGDKREVYLDILEDEAYERNYYKLIKNSKLTQTEIAELREATQRDLNEKKSKVRGVSRFSLRVSMIFAIVACIIVLMLCNRLNQTILNSFIYAIIAGQLTYLIVIILIESIREYVKKRGVNI